MAIILRHNLGGIKPRDYAYYEVHGNELTFLYGREDRLRSTLCYPKEGENPSRSYTTEDLIEMVVKGELEVFLLHEEDEE